jgi:hypothetical protein
MWVTLINGFQDVSTSITSLKANKLMNICGTTCYPVQDVWIWMIILISRITSSYDECIEVFTDFYNLSGFCLTSTVYNRIEHIIYLGFLRNMECSNCVHILIELSSVKDVWFGFRNCIQEDIIVPCKTQKELIIKLGKEYFPLQPKIVDHQEKILWLKDPMPIYWNDLDDGALLSQISRSHNYFSENFTWKTCLSYTHFVTSYEKEQNLIQSKPRAIRRTTSFKK